MSPAVRRLLNTWERYEPMIFGVVFSGLTGGILFGIVMCVRAMFHD